jgi:hypothetical protein
MTLAPSLLLGAEELRTMPAASIRTKATPVEGPQIARSRCSLIEGYRTLRREAGDGNDGFDGSAAVRGLAMRVDRHR